MRLIFAAGLAALAIAAWAPSMFAPFTYDDDHAIRDNPQAQGVVPISVRNPRLLTVITYRLNSGGETTFVYHAFNLVIHLLNSFLAFRLISALFGDEKLAWLATSIFLLHPVQVQAVTYLSGRPDLLVTAFSLGAMLAYLRQHYVLAGLACVGAALSKEVGIIAVALIAMLHLFRTGSRRFAAFSALAVSAFGVLAIYRSGQFFQSGPSWPNHFLTQNALIWRWASQWLWPTGFSIDFDGGGIGLAAKLACVALSGLAVLAAYKIQAIRLPLALIAIPLLPRLLISTRETLAAHHTYLPMLGGSILLGSALLLVSAWILDDPQQGDSYGFRSRS